MIQMISSMKYLYVWDIYVYIIFIVINFIIFLFINHMSLVISKHKYLYISFIKSDFYALGLQFIIKHGLKEP